MTGDLTDLATTLQGAAGAVVDALSKGDRQRASGALAAFDVLADEFHAEAEQAVNAGGPWATREVAPGESWIFDEHRTIAEVDDAENIVAPMVAP